MTEENTDSNNNSIDSCKGTKKIKDKTSECNYQENTIFNIIQDNNINLEDVDRTPKSILNYTPKSTTTFGADKLSKSTKKLLLSSKRNSIYYSKFGQPPILGFTPNISKFQLKNQSKNGRRMSAVFTYNKSNLRTAQKNRYFNKLQEDQTFHRIATSSSSSSSSSSDKGKKFKNLLPSSSEKVNIISVKINEENIHEEYIKAFGEKNEDLKCLKMFPRPNAELPKNMEAFKSRLEKIMDKLDNNFYVEKSQGFSYMSNQYKKQSFGKEGDKIKEFQYDENRYVSTKLLVKIKKGHNYYFFTKFCYKKGEIFDWEKNKINIDIDNVEEGFYDKNYDIDEIKENL